jgi:hypothetical protein
MPIAWFICPYKRDFSNPEVVARYCAMDDFTPQILADGGAWAESEILGDAAIVKVRASAATLTTIAGTAGFTRLPKALLDEPLSDLTQQQKSAIVNKLQALGYPVSEIKAALGNDIGALTLRQVLKFAARRRLKPRYDAANDQIVLDGAAQPVRPIEELEARVT